MPAKRYAVPRRKMLSRPTTVPPHMHTHTHAACMHACVYSLADLIPPHMIRAQTSHVGNQGNVTPVNEQPVHPSTQLHTRTYFSHIADERKRQELKAWKESRKHVKPAASKPAADGLHSRKSRESMLLGYSLRGKSKHAPRSLIIPPLSCSRCAHVRKQAGGSCSFVFVFAFLFFCFCCWFCVCLVSVSLSLSLSLSASLCSVCLLCSLFLDKAVSALKQPSQDSMISPIFDDFGVAQTIFTLIPT
jgi:hypothetical protein